MEKRTWYQVKEGFYEYVQFGCRIELREEDNPSCWEFRAESEARELYDSLDPRASWQVERNCSPCRHTHWAGGFRSLSVWEEEWDDELEELGEMELLEQLEYELFEGEDEDE